MYHNAEVGWQEVESDRAEICHQIIWNCAQTMGYPDFYRAWQADSQAG